MSEDKAVKESRERFLKDIKGHTMTVLRNDGLYRHVRFMKPRDVGGSEYWFDLITWPGNLVFRGDGDSFAFAREPDMFGFFGKKTLSINPGYWAQKLTIKQDVVKEYNKDLLIQHVREACDDMRDTGSASLANDVWEDMEDEDSNGMLETLEDARAFLNKWEGDDAWSDTWEWDLTGYDWWFLWALHGIVWGIQQHEAQFGPLVLTQEQVDLSQGQDIGTMGVVVG